MATFITSSDILRQIAKETVLGTVPTSGNRYEVPRKAGSGAFTFNGGEIISDTIRPGRNANGSKRGIGSGSGTIDLNTVAAPFVDDLIAGAISGAYDENGLAKAGTAPESSFTIWDKVAANEYDVNSGFMVSKWNFTSKAANELTTMSFEFVGLKQETKSTGPTGTTAVPYNDEHYEFTPDEVLNIKVDGNTSLSYAELSLDVEQARNLRMVLSSKFAAGISSPGVRNVTLTLKFFREPGADYKTLFTGDIQPFEFEIGGADDYGYIITVYGNASIPETVTEDDLMMTVKVTGAFNDTASALHVQRKPLPVTP